jgi:hypothetical protein
MEAIDDPQGFPKESVALRFPKQLRTAGLDVHWTPFSMFVQTS